MPNVSREDQLIQRQHEIWSKMEELLQAATNEERDFSGEERQEWDRAESDLDQVSKDIERIQRHARRDEPNTSGLIGMTQPAPSGETQEQRYEQAFDRVMRHGFKRASAEDIQLMEQRATVAGTNMGTNEDPAGGYTVPEGFRQYMEESLQAYGGIMNIAQNITTSSGNKLPWPVVTAGGRTSKGVLLTENTQMGEQAVEFGQDALDSFTYVSQMIRVSYQLLQDSAFDLNQYVAGVAGERIGRALAEHLATGDNSGQPQGVSQTSNTKTAPDPGDITYQDMLTLEHSIDPAYRNNTVRYLMSDETLKAIRGMTDADNRPLWVPVPAPGFTSRLNGYNYTIDNDLPDKAPTGATTGNPALYFGDFRRGYVVRSVRDVGLTRLDERYADFLQVGFFAYARYDAAIQDENAYGVLIV